MLVASAFVLIKDRKILDQSMTAILALGFVVSFVVALIVVKWLIRYVQRHNFTLFAVYRILFGGALLVLVLTHHLPAN